MESPILSADGFYMVLRWIHYMAGVVWIGLLYYFNFVQGAYFAEADAGAKSSAVRMLVPRALYWFRWGAMFTFLSGVVMLWHKGHTAGHDIYFTSWGVWILVGAALGTLMFLNVWFIIWPCQKVVIASANSVASGGQADPQAAAKGARALVASRTNTLFSIPMLFFMGAASHLPLAIDAEKSLKPMALVVALILLALELNAIKGKTGPLTTVRGVIHCGVALAVVLYLAVTLL